MVSAKLNNWIGLDEVVDEMIMVSLTNSHGHDTSLEALECIVMNGIIKHQPHSQLSGSVRDENNVLQL